MEGKIIRLGTDATLTYHNWPNVSVNETNGFIRELIGSTCRIYEHVMPQGLYTDLGIADRPDPKCPGRCVSMLIDEEGLLKHLPMNVIASWLYGIEEHGIPITGNVVFVGEMWTSDGIEFCPLDEMVFRYLYRRLECETQKAKRLVGMLGGAI